MSVAKTILKMMAKSDFCLPYVFTDAMLFTVLERMVHTPRAKLLGRAEGWLLEGRLCPQEKLYFSRGEVWL